MTTQYGDGFTKTAHECCSECGRPFTTEAVGKGPYLLDGDLIYRDHHRIWLTHNERGVMRPLLRAFGRAVHSEVLFRAFGERDVYAENLLRVTISTLRKKLHNTDLAIESLHTLGYRLSSSDNCAANVEKRADRRATA